MREFTAGAGNEGYEACGDAAAKMLEFEYAAILRDRIIQLKGEG